MRESKVRVLQDPFLFTSCLSLKFFQHQRLPLSKSVFFALIGRGSYIPDRNPTESPKLMAERPLECSECKKPITVRYTELVGKSCLEVEMCESCPVLQQKLQGPPQKKEGTVVAGAGQSLCCGNCGTTLDSVRTGHPLGCQECYAVFADILEHDLIAAGRVHQGENRKARSLPLHSGRTPGEVVKDSPAIRLVALNEALVETLGREDYEQAAHLRDQIKALTEGSDGEEKEEK